MSEELGTRRRGLFVTLGVILVVLIALGMKIREVTDNREGGVAQGDGGTSL